MRILVIGAGGVGSATVGIARRRPFFEHLVVADHDPDRVETALAHAEGDSRFAGPRVGASDTLAIVQLIREHRITHVLNAVDPRFVMPIFDACFAAGVTYMDMAMSLSRQHPEKPYELTGEKLGDAQFAKAAAWAAKGLLALVGMGVEPGLSDVFARYAQDHLFNEIHEVLRTLRKIGLDRTEPVSVKGLPVSPRDVVAACLPDPAGLGDRMHGKTCAGTWVTGLGKDGAPRQAYLYHVVDNAWTMTEYGSQAVVWQTAINPVVALELLARGTWQGAGVLGPEAFDAVPFLDLLTAYGSPWGMREGRS